jgi:cellobiose-specific phosphotransferase system component IIA
MKTTQEIEHEVNCILNALNRAWQGQYAEEINRIRHSVSILGSALENQNRLIQKADRAHVEARKLLQSYGVNP